jgi:hypothetical protein
MLDPPTHPLPHQQDGFSIRRIRHPASGIRHLVSGIWYPAADK